MKQDQVERLPGVLDSIAAAAVAYSGFQSSLMTEEEEIMTPELENLTHV